MSVWRAYSTDTMKEMVSDQDPGFLKLRQLWRTVTPYEADMFRGLREVKRATDKDIPQLLPIAWRLQKKEVKAILLHAQRSDEGIDMWDYVICGQAFPNGAEEIEHLLPKADVEVSKLFNHALTCGDCNDKKCEIYSYTGARGEVIKAGGAVCEDTADRAMYSVRRMHTLLCSLDIAITAFDKRAANFQAKLAFVQSLDTRPTEFAGVYRMTPKARRMYRSNPIDVAIRNMVREQRGDTYTSPYCPLCYGFIARGLDANCECSPTLTKAMRFAPFRGCVQARNLATEVYVKWLLRGLLFKENSKQRIERVRGKL